MADWKARLTVGDLDVARDLLAAVEPLNALASEVERGRRQLAASHAAALERRLALKQVRQAAEQGRDLRELSAIVARLRKIAGV